MKRILKGFLTIALLFVVAEAVAASPSCGAGGCGVSSTTGLACGPCGNTGTKECWASQCNDECERFRCCGSDYYCKTHFSPRTQGLDGARRLAGVTGTHLVDKDELYVNFDVALAFQRNFNTTEVGKFLSPNCGSNCFVIGDDGLPQTHVRNHDLGFAGTGEVCLCPRATSFIADFNFFVGLNEWLEGLFFELQLPLVHTWWEPNCCVSADQTDPQETFEAGLMNTDLDANNNCTTTEVGTTNVRAATQGNYKWGEITGTQCFGRICCDKQSKTRLADLRFRLGYDFLLKDSYYVGAKIIVAAPTGNKAESRFLWEPIAGNGGHWELGAGLTTRAVIWDKDEDKALSWHLDAEVTHMFKSRTQYRSFDLADNECFSRYLLLKRFSQDGSGNPILHPEGALERGIDVFTQDVKVRVDVQLDLTSFFRVRYNNWLFDFGYNAWARSREKLYDLCCSIPEKTFGIKGNEPLCENGSDNIETASASTMREAAASDGDDPVFIKNDCSDLDICSASHPGTHSHSVFGHLGYKWEDIDWEPVVGFGGKAEFSGRGNTALNQWAIWAKGSVSF